MPEIKYCVFMDLLGYKARVMDNSKTPEIIEVELQEIYTNIAVQCHFVITEINKLQSQNNQVFVRSFSDSIYFECNLIEPLIFICHNVFNYVFGFFKSTITSIGNTPLLRCGISKDWTGRFNDIAEIVNLRHGLNVIGKGVARAYMTSEETGFSGMRIILSPEVFDDLQCTRFENSHFECYYKPMIEWKIPTNYLFKHLQKNRDGDSVNFYELMWPYNSLENGDFSHIKVLLNIEPKFKEDAVKHIKDTAQLFYDSLLLTMWNRPLDYRFEEQGATLKKIIGEEHNNLIVFCLKCNGHFKWEETHAVKVKYDGPTPKGRLYICNGCYEALPVTNEEYKPYKV